jgi:integrase
MASLTKETQNGREVWRLTFYDKNGKRRRIRLGEMGKKAAEAILIRVRDLVDIQAAGLPLDGALTAWLADRGDELYEKLVGAELIAPRSSATLDEFITTYIDGRVDAQPNTRRNFHAARRSLVDHFGKERNLREINAGDAHDWKQAMLQAGLSEATVNKRIKIVRQYFKLAQQKGLVYSNPFAELKGGSERNDKRLHFIDRLTIERVIRACPNNEWKLIVALSRYGGLRSPSETLNLKWSDVLWDEQKLVIHSPKTERHGKPYRTMPLFPELRTYLETAFDEAPEGTIYVIRNYRDATNANLRTQLLRILKRAGVVAWERLFHNLRASRQTELVDQFPAKVVSDWLGNSPRIAEQHYLKTTEHHFEKAVNGQAHGAKGGADMGQAVGPNRSAQERTTPQKTSHKPQRDNVLCAVMGYPSQACEGMQIFNQYSQRDSKRFL